MGTRSLITVEKRPVWFWCWGRNAPRKSERVEKVAIWRKWKFSMAIKVVITSLLGTGMTGFQVKRCAEVPIIR